MTAGAAAPLASCGRYEIAGCGTQRCKRGIGLVNRTVARAGVPGVQHLLVGMCPYLGDQVAVLDRLQPASCG
jgi:hypothetical protein